MKSSRIPGFYNLSPEERLKAIKEFAGLTEEEVEILRSGNALSIEQADRMIENVYSIFQFPLGIATNFKINGRDYLIPMALEEPSVVAAASNGAKIALKEGGFKAESTGSVMIGEIQVITNNPEETERKILEKKEELINLANQQDPTLLKYGGGAKNLETKCFSSENMVIIYLYVDCRDAMGANAVNTMCESLAPEIEKITGGKTCLKIVSNLADRRLVKVSATFDKEALGGEKVVDSIIDAYKCAELDQYRATTHNKGIMNGVDAVVIATGNDFRAVEAGAHSYAAVGGRYKPLSKYEKDGEGNLVGTLEMPIAVGIVGGATKVHPVAKISLKILGVKSASELSQVIGAVGLAQNLAALRALADEGIQKGHMKLHARNLAATAGAKGEEIDRIAAQMISEGNVGFSRAEEILKEIKGE